MRAVAVLAFATLVGCTAGDAPFRCAESRQCVLAGAQGICEPNGHCSFPDPSCPGGRRFGEHAPAGVAGACVKARVCGDGERSVGEECDDGNRLNDDGCTNACVRCGPGDGDARVSWEPTGACYTRHDRPLDWMAAAEACVTAGGHLAALATGREHDAVTSALAPAGAALWIGLSDRAVEGTFAWVTSEPVLIRRWRAGQPEDRTETQDCVHLAGTAEWVVRECGSALPYLCERPPWVVRPVDRHAYRMIYRPMTWDQAQQACVQLGGHLVTITSEEEQAFVVAHFFGTFWIGAHDRAEEGTFRWVTGEPFVYRNFAPGEPDNHANAHHCLHLGEERRWHDYRCEDRRPALCEVD